MTGVARRKQALSKVDQARSVLTGLVRLSNTKPPQGLAAQVAHHRALIAAWRALSNAYWVASESYRQGSPTEMAMLDARRATNTVVAHLEHELASAGGR